MDDMEAQQLTRIQSDTLDYLRDFITTNGYAPTVRQMCVALGVTSTATIQDRLVALERAGYIERVGSRAIRILSP